tara:strand:+ start:117 stop:311 length:195 start_codon:yes stop_codon:yes gene_type:complete
MTNISYYSIPVTKQFTLERNSQIDALLGSDWNSDPDLHYNTTDGNLHAWFYCTEQQATIIRLLL